MTSYLDDLHARLRACAAINPNTAICVAADIVKDLLWRAKDKGNISPSTVQHAIRREAQMRGRKTYFTGEPCQHGHIFERFVKRAWCVECARLGKKPEPRATKTYFTGEPCKYGHVCERYVAGGGCVECSKERSQKWQAAHHARMGGATELA